MKKINIPTKYSEFVIVFLSKFIAQQLKDTI